MTALQNTRLVDIYPPEIPKSMTKRQQVNTTKIDIDEFTEPLFTIDELSVYMEVVCNKFAEAALKESGNEVNIENLVVGIFDNTNRFTKEDKNKRDELLKQVRHNIKPSNSGSCTTGDYVKLVKWAVKEKTKEVSTFRLNNADGEVVFCEDSKHCYLQRDYVQADVTFSYAKSSAVEKITDYSIVQPNQLHRRSWSEELNTLSSSATSSLQYSSFRDSGSMTITMVLMVILYMCIFNIRG